jgi:succinate-semialdehyde dehydrogenase/glutarate-semialdehyde dehydrogenase
VEPPYQILYFEDIMNRFLQGSALINGIWIERESIQSIPVRNPVDDEIIGYCPRLTEDDVEQAISAAHSSFQSWSALPASQRGLLLLQWHDAILENVDALAEVITMENGKPLAESKGEVRYTASFVRWFAEEASRIYGTEIPSNHPQQRILVRKEPVGVCGIITPWNFPSAMLGRKLAAALAAGCTVVAKPSEETPMSAFALARLAQEVGIPDGVINLVTGDPAQIGRQFCASKKISKISFTGSTRVGRLLMAQSGARLHRMSLELGGNAPFVVCADANTEKAATGLMISKFRNCGQTCIASNRIILHKSKKQEFLNLILPRIQELKVGNGMDSSTQLGPIITLQGAEKIRLLVQDAIDKGAQLLLGVIPAKNSRFIEPIVLDGVDESMDVWNTEIFGPVVSIRTFLDDEEGIQMANDTEYGLAAYVFTEGHSRSWRYREALQFGMVGLNTGRISTAQAPFGGVKQSGFGREGSWIGLDEYLSYKYICVDFAST